MRNRDLLSAVQEFFVQNKLYKVVNCSLVTLISKRSGAKTMKDIRPIACCTMVYKIISKILTNRPNKVINSLGVDSQTTFFSGKTIHDSIIMAYELM